MDIAAGLALLGQATGIVKNLREIDKGFDIAALKSQMAELYGALADVKISLSDARESIHERDQKIKELEQKIAVLTSGEQCPLCNEARLKVIAVNPDPVLGDLGVQERTLRCEKCKHTERRHHDPTSMMKAR